MSACPGEQIGAACISAATTLTATALNIEANKEIARLNRDLQEKMQNDRFAHDKELQQNRMEFDERMADKHITAQEALARQNTWRNFLTSKGLMPFDIGTFKQSMGINADKLIILIDTKVYQEEGYSKATLHYNPMQILFDEFTKVNNQTGENAYPIDINIALGSQSHVRQFCRNEFYNNPAIIVYSKFSGTHFSIYALCQGIFIDQLYVDTENSTINQNPLGKCKQVELGTFPLKRLHIPQDREDILEEMASCMMSSFLQMLIDCYILFNNKIKNYEPQAKAVYKKRIEKLQSYFDKQGKEEFAKVGIILDEAVKNAKEQQQTILDLCYEKAFCEIKKNYIQ